MVEVDAAVARRSTHRIVARRRAMTVQPSSVPLAEHPLLRAVLLAVLAIAVVVAVTAIAGVAVAGPSIDLVADPAGMAVPF
jgi:hypothetical protein